MHTIVKSDFLLHKQIELPIGFKTKLEEFREGWNWMRGRGVIPLEKKIRKHGWNLIHFVNTTLRSGIGDTSQEAIASALKLALRRVDSRSNAIQIEAIELIKYPWFFIAKVQVDSYRIQAGAALS